MITAQQAREKSENKSNVSVQQLIQDCNKQIEYACESCNRACTVSVDKIPYTAKSNVIALVMADLQSRGFKVERNSGCDSRDNYGWDYLDISW